MSETIAAVAARSLAVTRGKKPLFAEMSWTLPRGKFLAVTGASGAGKSSLLACFGGFVQPTAGAIEIAALERVGFVFQNFRLTKNLSVLTNVLCGKLGAYSWRQTLFGFGAADKQAAFEILGRLNLEKLIHRPVRAISGGEQQRTAIARVLLQNPDLILADEPVSNLDAALAKRVLTVLRESCWAEQKTVIAVLHDASMVREFADYELKIAADEENGWKFCKIAA